MNQRQWETLVAVIRGEQPAAHVVHERREQRVVDEGDRGLLGAGPIDVATEHEHRPLRGRDPGADVGDHLRGDG